MNYVGMKLFYLLLSVVVFSSCVDYDERGLLKAIYEDDVRVAAKIIERIDITNIRYHEYSYHDHAGYLGGSTTGMDALGRAYLRNMNEGEELSELTPLQFAILSSSFKVAEFLVSHTKNVNAVSSEGYSALMYAIMHQQPQLVRLLLESGVDPMTSYGFGGYTPMHWAIKKDDEVVMGLLVEHGAFLDSLPNGVLFPPLNYAIMNQHPLSVNWLIEHGADPYLEDVNGNNAFEAAIEDSRFDVLSLLLQKFDFTVDDALFSKCCYYGDSQLLELVMKSGSFSKALMSSCFPFSGNIGVCDYLLSQGVSINAVDPKTHFSAIHLACIRGDAEMLRHLYDKGADIGLAVKSNPGNTPLILAVAIHEGLDDDSFIQLNPEVTERLGFSNSKTPEKSLAVTRQLLEWGKGTKISQHDLAQALNMAEQTNNNLVAELIRPLVKVVE